MIDNDYEGVQKLHCLTEYNEEETMQMFKEEGRQEGEKAGETKLGQLIAELLSSGRTGDAQKAATDEKTRQILYQEFHIVK